MNGAPGVRSFGLFGLEGVMKPNRIDEWHRRVAALAALIAAASLLAPQELRAAAGVLDPRFGHGGIALTDFRGNDDYGFAARVQPDGKIVVAGQSGVYPLFHSALARYNG